MRQIETAGRAAFGDAPLLRGASAQVLDELADAAREVRIDARNWLFRAGEGADRL